MRKGMQTAILLLLVGACLQTGKAQSCTAGNLEFSEQYCWYGGGWRTVLYCQAQGGSEYGYCENGIHVVNCSSYLCDIYDAGECSLSPKRAHRVSELDTLAPLRPVGRV